MFPHTKPPAGTQINPLHPLSNGLVGCWLFNEGAGSLANDVSGYKNHGRLKNMAPNVQGSGWGGSKLGGGLEFDGVDDYVILGGDDSFKSLTKGTISFWFNIPDLSAASFLFSVGTKSQVSPGLFLWIIANSDGSLLVQQRNNSVSDDDICFTSDVGIIEENVRYHLTYKVNSVGNFVYLNGTQIELTYSTGSSATSYFFNDINTTQNYFISGAKYNSTTVNRFGNGTIDSVSIYNRALLTKEVMWSYREPYAMFEPAFNPALLYSAAPPVGAIMNQFQKANIGADLYNGVFA